MTPEHNLKKFLEIYNQLGIDTLDSLETVYAKDIHFIDPAHELHGREALKLYFAELYKNVNRLSFTFEHHLAAEEKAFVSWRMNFSHPKLKNGDDIVVPGTSLLQFNPEGKVRYHQDYFDLGGMLYENIPLMGSIISGIKRRLSQ